MVCSDKCQDCHYSGVATGGGVKSAPLDSEKFAKNWEKITKKRERIWKKMEKIMKIGKKRQKSDR